MSYKKRSQDLSVEEVDLKSPDLYINRELSLLEFNARVLEQAKNESVPLLERLRYLCISSTNLDEFFEVRVAGEIQKSELGSTQTGADNMSPQEVLKAIRSNKFDSTQPDLFKELYNDLAEHGDYYFYLADFEQYIACQEKVSALYADRAAWAEKAILNVARMGWFSSDRSIQDYCDNIWHLERTPIKPSEP